MLSHLPKMYINGSELYHNCIECKFDYFFEMTIPNKYLNCYNNCFNYTYDIINDKFICFDYPKCSKSNEKYIPNIIRRIYFIQKNENCILMFSLSKEKIYLRLFEIILILYYITLF